MTFPTVSLHNHTIWSDGATTVQELVDEAARIGLAEIGISDHYTLSLDDRGVEWSMQVGKLAEYVGSVRSAGEESAVRVLLGIEADFFPESVEILRERLAEFPFDYVIGSVHFVNGFAIDSRPEDWAALSASEVNSVWIGYWDRVCFMAETGLFDIAGHLDLPKKFGFMPTSDLRRQEAAALEAISESGMSIEINTNGWNLPCAEAYPSLRLLKQARSLGIPLVISSDAHHPRRLVDGFDRARELAIEAGYTELSRYVKRRRTAYPL